MADRIWNFNPGPSTLPLPVLEKIKEQLPNYNHTGMAVMELSHRSKDFIAVHEETKSLIAELFGVPENYKILFLQGGASLQFAMIPMNLLGNGRSADYINTGTWSKKAIKEAKLFGNVNVAGTSEDTNFNRVPKQDELKLDPNAVYVHTTSNNTIAGTQWAKFPDTGNVPIVCDMSSDILSRKLDISKFGIIYAGAQKNLGPSGVTVVIISDDMVEKSSDTLTTMLKYKTHVDKDSMFNTPPTFSIYIMNLVLKWIKDQGGLAAVEKTNMEKGKLLYGTMDNNKDFFRGATEVDSRSLMNVTMRLPNEELEAKFIADGLAAGFGGLKGHRSVGGIRVSMYNALPLEGIQALTEFMLEFAKKNG